MHEGHRARIVGKLKNPETLYEHELMEILLFNACPRKDVNGIAHNLIDRFGSIEGVLRARVDELVETPGIGTGMAEYLRCLGLCLGRAGGGDSFASVRNTYEFSRFISSRADGVADKIELYFLDMDGRIRRIRQLSAEGGAARAAEKALKAISSHECESLYAAHFTGGAAVPTPYDDEWAAAIAYAGSFGGKRLNDYCIIGGDKSVYSYFVTDRLSNLRFGEQ